MLTRRRLIAVSAATVFAPHVLRVARAASWPDRPVHLIVPIAAGGPTDTNARLLADQLSNILGQQVVVDNKPGAGTNIGSAFVAHADADGYTLLFGTSSLAANTALYRSLDYDPETDFTPVSLVAKFPFFVFVPNSSPAHSIKEFIDYVKSRPGKLTMASPGTGSAPFLAEMLFLQMADIKMTHVPYRGASLAFTDLIPGRVDCLFSGGASLSYSRSGQVRVLATSGPKRDVAAPDVPTIAEAGVPGYDVTGWQALFVPAKTPPEVVRKISADTNTALANPAIRDKLAETGYAAGGSSPEELGTLLKSEIVRWSALVKSVGITLD